MKICVVEDEQTVRKGIIDKITELFPHANVFDVGYGMEAKERLLLIRPDVVFLDIFMPEMGGLDMLRAIRNKLPDTRFVILTGYREFEFAREAMQLGAVNYLLKPVYHKDLSAVIEETHREMVVQTKNELSDGIKQLAVSGCYLAIQRVVNPSEWLDDHQAKKVVFEPPAGSHDGLENRIFQFIIDGKLTGAVMGVSAESAVGESRCFYDRSEWVQRMQDAWHLHLTERFFAEDERSASVRNTAEPLPIQVKARKIREAVVRLFESRPVEAALMTSEVKKWLGVIGELPLRTLRHECAVLLFVLDQALQQRHRSVIEQDEFRYWHEWVSSFGDWRLLQGRIIHLVLKGFVALDELNDKGKLQTLDLVARIEDMVDNTENVRELSLERVAKRLQLHAVTVSKLFKKKTGVNFIDFLTERKMNRANDMLTQTTKTVRDIAYELGYANFRYFGKLYKNQFGKTPQQTRNEDVRYDKRNE